jgi:hypothetical protein
VYQITQNTPKKSAHSLSFARHVPRTGALAEVVMKLVAARAACAFLMVSVAVVGCATEVAEDTDGTSQAVGAPAKTPPLIDRDGCGIEARPKGSCNASKILANIGKNPAIATGEAVGCVSCARTLVAAGMAVYASGGTLLPTAIMTWGTVEATAGCGLCIAFLKQSGIISTASCLVDRLVSGACEYDRAGHQQLCTWECATYSNKLGYIPPGASVCKCTSSGLEARCGGACTVPGDKLYPDCHCGK